MMNVEQFQAPDQSRALDLVRGRLGPDAVILGTRTVHPKGWAALLKRSHVEVFAAPPSPPPPPPGASSLAFAHLTERGVGEELAERLSSGIEGEEGAFERPLRLAVEKWARQRIGSLDGARCVMLVGPTGAGKTTTLAKLAAREALDEGRRVGLITTDTTRIGAIGHLQTYAEIMDLPWSVAEDASALGEAKEALGTSERILVDTSGRNFRHRGSREEVAALARALRPDAVVLVVPLTTGADEIRILRDSFEGLAPTGTILTKLDEAAGPGKLLGAMDLLGLPLLAVTTGQMVPDDIWFPGAERLAKVVLEGVTS